MLIHIKSLFLQHCNKYYLNKKTTIKQLFSICMLVLFAFSITPRKTLHIIFGCHSDTGKTINHSEAEQLTTKSFHCSCDYQDFQSPFLHTPTFLSSVAFIYGDPFITGYKTELYKQTILSNNLRGPPTLN